MSLGNDYPDDTRVKINDRTLAMNRYLSGTVIDSNAWEVQVQLDDGRVMWLSKSVIVD